MLLSTSSNNTLVKNIFCTNTQNHIYAAAKDVVSHAVMLTVKYDALGHKLVNQDFIYDI